MAETELTSSDFTESAAPFRLFGEWLEDAVKTEPNDPNAVALATNAAVPSWSEPKPNVGQ